MDEFNKIISSEKPTLVDFFATWCGPCKVQGQILETLKEKVGDEATIVKIDIDKNQDAAVSYGVRSVPTLMIFKAGKPVWRGVGVHDGETLAALLRDQK